MSDFLSNFESKSESKDEVQTVEKNIPSQEDAFSEEEFVYDREYAKNKIFKRITTIIAALIILGTAFVIYTQLSTTTMKNFVGLEYTQMSNFVSKNSLIVIINKEYSNDIDEDIVIAQDILAEQTIRKGSSIIITVSAGPDPEEVIDVPKLEDMTHLEILEWVELNNLNNVTVRTQYDSNVEAGGFLNATFVEGSSEQYKRKNRLTIYTSKGPEPIPTDVALIDFTSMAKDQIVEWGENNEVKFTFKYYFSDSIAKDTAIRQSISSGTRVEKGSSVTIDISIGPSVLIPDFSTMDKDEVSKWATDNSFDVVIKEIYLAYYSKGDYISQSIAKGKTVSVSSMIEVKFALGNPYINSYVGSSKYDFNDFVVSLNKKGTSITVKTKHEYSSSIAKHSLIYQSKENEKVELNEEITIIVSKGERYIVENVVGLTEEDARTSTLCQKMTCVFETIDNSDSGIPSGQVLSQSITTGEVVGLPEMITIKIKR